MDDGRIPAEDMRAKDAELAAHERTYHAFNVLLRWCMVAIASSTVTFVLWFVGSGGWFGGLVAGVVLFVVGYALLIRPEEHKPSSLWSARG